MNKSERNKVFIDRDKLYSLIEGNIPEVSEVNTILNKALKLKGLNLEEVATLLRVEDPAVIRMIMDTARSVKEEIYGKRLVLFAPIYTGNVCINNCTYCSFRRDNKLIKRKVLTMDEIAEETKTLLREGHKRVLLICGESSRNNTDYMVEAIRTTYAARENGGRDYIRRINVELAPMEVEDFARLKAEKIGTYVCFQETYDPVLYKNFHPADTQKGNYEYRLTVMDRAMEGGINDVGIGALLGLIDYRFEVLAMMEHAHHLETAFGCGPHTVSVPRIEPAVGAPNADQIPSKVSDNDFKKLVAIIRIALPYTGIILSTRENDAMRTELIHYGVSQISAGSRTNPGSYTHEEEGTGSQFTLGDHRTLDQMIYTLANEGFIPSFCTGCYRKGRVGQDFMDLAKPGLIKQYCMPNALFTFKEYLEDFASPETKEQGLKAIDHLVGEVENTTLKSKINTNLESIGEGQRDIYF
ncbi:MAG TPA: [FeFe] hydrogenase H-cluster radical SAM maturase HydG [Bacteroidales bacterium]|nr:[FeFe] hydrogenase H-cluster radical SAM maturase HydG [Bacteroidales bacterium]HPS72844.1 [FeFe] hydrogenase H-cluster radical SAM maturase HydG [Bacteroidales bacterium]